MTQTNAAGAASAREMPAFEIRPLEGRDEFAACVALQERTWGRDFNERVPSTILRIAQETGGIASGAFAPDGSLIGFVFGITGWVGGAPLHWSDMLAVAPEARDRGVGIALKLHQRQQLLARGVDVVVWTFDPLEARNAHVNLSRLGAVARTHRRDYYEGSSSPLHAGIGTDRLFVTWEIAGERVAQRLAGATRAPALDDVLRAAPLNAIEDAAMPRCAEPRMPDDASRVRIAVPADIQALRDRDLGLAVEWRQRTRAAFEAALSRGYETRELVRDGAVAWYLLERGTAAQPARVRRDFIS